jgi:hypothetical protein
VTDIERLVGKLDRGQHRQVRDIAADQCIMQVTVAGRVWSFASKMPRNPWVANGDIDLALCAGFLTDDVIG